MSLFRFFVALCFVGCFLFSSSYGIIKPHDKIEFPFYTGNHDYFNVSDVLKKLLKKRVEEKRKAEEERAEKKRVEERERLSEI